MAGSINIAAYSDALVVLGTAGIVVPLVRRSGVSPILGYLGAGAVLGPLGLGTFVKDIPLLYWLTVVDAKNVSAIADLGIVFLLFLIGLEMSFQRLTKMRRLVLGLGLSQVLLTTTLFAWLAHMLGAGPTPALVIGMALALSSTAIVIELLSGQGRLNTSLGRTTFSVLLAQDLAVVPILLFVSMVTGGDGSGSLSSKIGLALLQTAIALTAIVVLGRLFLRPLFRMVASQQSNELFVAAILFVIVATGVVAASAGLSMALGAFVAGLLLSETEYRRAIEGIVAPFKGLLLGIFFFTVGMTIDIREIIREPAMLLVAVVGLIAIKTVIILFLCRLFSLSWPVSLEAALLLSAGGEFAFVVIDTAVSGQVMPQPVASFWLAVTALTMALLPGLAAIGRRIDAWADARKPLDPELEVRPAITGSHAIVVGHGRVGQVVCALLRRHKVPFIVTDSDAGAVGRDRRAGIDVYYGDASSPAFLDSCGIREATGVIITIHTQATIDLVVQRVRAVRPDIPIISRARDAAHSRHLYSIGVTDAVPETIEASLQLSEASLTWLGVPTGKVIASIHEKRDEFRHEIQSAAQEAGRSAVLGIKAKSDKAG
ncbi:MAG: cation:proton antiporter [Beijerinckiaceae bacterium]|nr:cation:proton antiporter [Beijerinckiaceae bacterium]MCZ8299715.1 cation:proton antiporter [Beijerinckiaceae bacterium]